ncbi:hypothetical protein M7I_0698 [Glarea lozoyensis 74030]|uniref:Uncharacterized protein n=1 Tax=Glarea lozoyensis (strain ATCC 74030 / MF5533) TaxID=1104152 RepID=H0EE30_GLAL7|nr:hypothetical protein M7I_0698 [Glarea lozoyensis 74030]
MQLNHESSLHEVCTFAQLAGSRLDPTIHEGQRKDLAVISKSGSVAPVDAAQSASKE